VKTCDFRRASTVYYSPGPQEKLLELSGRGMDLRKKLSETVVGLNIK